MANENNIFLSGLQVSLDDLPKVPITKYLFEKIRKHLPRTGNSAWITDTVNRRSVTFSEVEPLSKKVASALTKRGFKKGDILYYITKEMATIDLFILGAWCCNGAIRGGCPVDRPEDQTILMKESNARFIVCDKETESLVKAAISNLEWTVNLFSIDDVEGAIPLKELLKDDGKAFNENLEVDVMKDIIYLPTTSGSTGLPKGAQYSHCHLLSVFHVGPYIFEPRPTLITFSNFHVAGLLMGLMNLTEGVPLYTMPTFSEQRFLEAVQEYKPCFIGAFPFIFVWLSKTAETEKYDLSSLDTFFSGGAPLSIDSQKDLFKKFPNLKEIQQVYAMTECLGICTSNVAKSVYGKDVAIPFNSAGMLIPNVKAKVVCLETGKSLGANQPGELLIQAPHQTIGYLNRPKATEELIDKEGWLHTGDVAYFDSKGFLYITERVKETFKHQAHHVSPTELEALVETHPAVMVAGVIAVPDPTCTAVAKAIVVKKPGHSVTEEEIQKFIADQTPYYKHLKGGVLFVDSLPLTGTGKISRPSLRTLYGK